MMVGARPSIDVWFIFHSHEIWPAAVLLVRALITFLMSAGAYFLANCHAPSGPPESAAYHGKTWLSSMRLPSATQRRWLGLASAPRVAASSWRSSESAV